MSSIDSPPTVEKFRLVDTVSSILEKPPTSFCVGIELASLNYFLATVFKFKSAELRSGKDYYEHMWLYFDSSSWGSPFTETKKVVPEPILSHRLANVAILCMQYLHRWDSNTPPTRDHFLARKLKQSPWLWRRRMRVTPIGRRQRIWNLRLSLQDRQVFDYKTIQSEYFCQEQLIFYTWTLDLLYNTLRKAMKSDELTRALSKPFIPSLAPLLFPRRVKRIRKAAAAYLEKVSRRSSYENTR